MKLISISAFTDNYIWILQNDHQQCLVVDPGESHVVLKVLQERRLSLAAILLTHHHSDHVGGVENLLRHFAVPVYGPEETINKGANRLVVEGDKLLLLDRNFSVLSFPGHTLGHIGFYSPPWLFCGDTVFSAGCGRLYEGTPKQMYASLQKVNQLPPETLICAAHEYTLNNLIFATTILPEDLFLAHYKYKITELIIKNKPSLPTTLDLERRINLFLRCHRLDLQKKLDIFVSQGEEWRVFALLREKKDHFVVHH